VLSSFGSLFVAGRKTQPQMVFQSAFEAPSSWSESNGEGRVVALPPDELLSLGQMYVKHYYTLGLGYLRGVCSPFSPTAWQVRGRLWTGSRYFQAYYYRNDDDRQLGYGYCCVSYVNSTAVTELGVIRDIILHKPFSLKLCPSVYMFIVEPLVVTAPTCIADLEGWHLYTNIFILIHIYIYIHIHIQHTHLYIHTYIR
jgi:hypothetical protein